MSLSPLEGKLLECRDLLALFAAVTVLGMQQVLGNVFCVSNSIIEPPFAHLQNGDHDGDKFTPPDWLSEIKANQTTINFTPTLMHMKTETDICVCSGGPTPST